MNILLAINQYCICLEYIVVNPRNIIRVNCLQMYKNLHIGNSFCSRFCSCDLFYFILTVFTISYLIVLRLKYSCNSLSSLSHVHAGYILDSRSKSYSNNITNAHTQTSQRCAWAVDKLIYPPSKQDENCINYILEESLSSLYVSGHLTYLVIGTTKKPYL